MSYEKMTYTNHLGERIELGSGGYFVNANGLHDYAWTPSSRGGRIASFSRGVTKYTLPVAVTGGTEAEATARRNRLLDVTDADVDAMQPGRLTIGDYFLRCYIMASQKKQYNRDRRFYLTTLTVVSDDAYWVKEYTSSFSSELATGASGALDYPYDFAFDYMSPLLVQAVNNVSYAPADFILNLYGPCENPVVRVAGHEYAVSHSAAAGEYITIDSRARTLTLTKASGVKVNIFKDRGLTDYIFERIPAGTSSVTWDGELRFDLTVLARRSEPLWI